MYIHMYINIIRLNWYMYLKADSKYILYLIIFPIYHV